MANFLISMETRNATLFWSKALKGLSGSFESNYLIHPFLAQFIMSSHLECPILKLPYNETPKLRRGVLFINSEPANSWPNTCVIYTRSFTIYSIKIVLSEKTDISTNLPVSFSGKTSRRQFLTNRFESNSLFPEARSSTCKWSRVYQGLLCKRVPHLMD